MSDTPPWINTPPPGAPPWVTSPIGGPGPVAAAQPKPKPESRLGNIGRGLKGAYDQAASSGLLMQPVRWLHEGLDLGGYRKKFEEKFPGRSDEWYDQQVDKLYDTAITSARQDAARRVEENPYPGHQVGNFVAGVLGSAGPDWFVAPGVGLAKGALKGTAGQVARNVASHVGKQAAVQGTVGGATDLVTQGFDIAEGMQDGIDAKRLATAAGYGAGFGAGFAGVQAGVHSPGFQKFVQESDAPEFVKKAFTVPSDDPPPWESKVGQESSQLTPEQLTRQREVFSTGSADDIRAFYDEVGGARPSDKSLDNWIEQRSKMSVPAAPKPEVIQRQAHRDNIRAHVDERVKTWKNAPKVNIYDDLSEMTPEMQASAQRDGITPDNTVGFLGTDGQVHIFAGQVKTPEIADSVLFHESLGHYGLAQKFGDRLDSVLNTLATRNVGQFGKAVAKWMKDHPNAYGGDKTRAAEEVLAEMSEKGRVPKALMDAIIAQVNQFGRQMGITTKYTDAEVRHILAMSHDAVINGKGRDVIANRFGGISNYQPTELGADTNRQMYAGQRADTAPSVREEDWFTGPDGGRRFEISDHEAQWTGYGLDSGDLDEFIRHPDLFKTYPELRKTKVSMEDLGSGSLRRGGTFFPRENKIVISTANGDPLGTILHEIQHWIQYKEGWATGGQASKMRLDSSDNLNKLGAHYSRLIDDIPLDVSDKRYEVQRNILQKRLDKVNELKEAKNEIGGLYEVLYDSERKLTALKVAGIRYRQEMEELAAKINQPIPTSELLELTKRQAAVFDKFNEALAQRNQLVAKMTKVKDGLQGIKRKYIDIGFDMYKMLTGEVEARDVQARQFMDAEQRRQVDPFTSENILPDEMITVRSNTPLGGADSRATMGDEPVDPNLLDEVDRLKANPRFWSDPEFRANVIELARSKTSRDAVPESAIPAASGYASEAEARAALEGNRQLTVEQLQRRIESGQVDEDHLRRVYADVYNAMPHEKRTDQQIRDAAKQAGFAPSRVKRLPNLQDLSVRIFRAQEAAKVLDARITPLVEKVDTGNATDRDRNELRKAFADHYAIVSQLYDDKSEIGRALRISKMGYTHAEMQAYKEMLAEDGGPLGPLADDDTLNRLLRSWKIVNQNGANPNGVNNLVRGMRKPNWEEYVLSARVNMLLSGMSTHVTAITDMIDGIGYDLMDSTAGLIPSLGREGLRAVGINVKPGIHPAEVGARFWGVLRAAMEAQTYANAWKTLRDGSQAHTSGGRMYARIPIISKVGDLIAAEDMFFRAFATNMHLYGLGVRRAVEEARNAGKKPSVGDLIAAGTAYAQNPDPKMLREAQRAAEENLLLAPNMLTAPLDTIRRSANVGNAHTTREKTINAGQRAVSFAVNFMLPFIRTAANSLYQRIWRRTPLTMLDPHTVADLREGGVKADIAMGRIMLGTASVALLWKMAEQGIISGEGPDNLNEKAIKMATGWRPKSVKVEGEEGTRFQINQNLGNRLNPFDPNSQLAGIVASMHEAFNKGANQGQVATGMKLAVYSAVKGLGDNAWLEDFMKSYYTFTAPGAHMTDKRDQWVADQLASFTPNLGAQIARTQDQGQPFTTNPGNLEQTIIDTFKSRIPGQRETLPDRMTPLGKPVQSGATIAGQSTGLLPQGNRVTGGAYIEQTTDPAELEILRLDEMFEGALITPVKRTFGEGSDKVKLTNEQFSRYQEEAGLEIVYELNEKMQTEDWSQMSDEDRAEWINKMQTQVKKRVRGYLFPEFFGEE